MAKKMQRQCNRSEGRKLKRTGMFCSTYVRRNIEGSACLDLVQFGHKGHFSAPAQNPHLFTEAKRALLSS